MDAAGLLAREHEHASTRTESEHAKMMNCSAYYGKTLCARPLRFATPTGAPGNTRAEVM